MLDQAALRDRPEAAQAQPNSASAGLISARLVYCFHGHVEAGCPHQPTQRGTTLHHHRLRSRKHRRGHGLPFRTHNGVPYEDASHDWR
jgi:hypothetical protein